MPTFGFEITLFKKAVEDHKIDLIETVYYRIVEYHKVFYSNECLKS